MPRPLLIVSRSDNLIQVVDTIHTLNDKTVYIVDPDQLASDLDLQCTLFAKTGHIQVQHDQD